TSIRSFGFDCVVGRQVKTHKQLEEAVEHFRKLREKKGSVFFCDIDGAVLKVSSYGIRQLLGDTSHHPRWAVAFKYPPMSGLSTLEDIEITVGRTGVLTPVGKVTPVKIGGVQITSVNLANFDKIETLGVSIGDTVELVRAGDVIPDVVSVTKKGIGEAFKTPTHCPCCGTELQRKEVEVYCPNIHGCVDQLKQNLVYY